MLRKVLFQVHLWAGLILSIPFFVLGLSGSILVFDQDVIGKLDEKPPVVATAGPIGSLDAIAAAALAGKENMRVTQISAPERDGAPALVRLGAGGGGERRGEGGPGGAERRGPAGPGGPAGGAQTVVSIDPVTYAVLDSGPQATAMWRWMHQLHGNFLTPGVGRQLVGWAGVLMLVMGLSGIVLWWPKKGQWRRAFTVRASGPSYRFNRDLHGAVGIWLWAVFIVVTFTGIYISFPQPMAKAVISVAPGRDMRATPQIDREGRITPIGFDGAYAAAQKAAPNARLLAIIPAARADQPLRVTLAQPGWQAGAPSVTVFLDPADASVLDVRDPRTFTFGEAFQAWMRALHEGIGVNIFYKILVFLSGLAPPLFVITGVLMWLKKREAKRRTREPALAPAEAANSA